jgi:hypothetical protein
VSESIVIEFRDDFDILEISVLDCGPTGALLPGGDAAAAGADAGEVVAEEAAQLLESATISASEPAYLERTVDVASIAPRLGLAMIAGLVDDMSVEDRTGADDARGTVVTMRWPTSAA